MRQVMLGLGIALAGPWAAAAEPAVTEEVEVRLVLVDTVVVDRGGRTVDDLGPDDFELFVDYDPRTIDTFDVHCPAGASDDPRPVRRLGTTRPPVAPAAPRRIVLAMDYMHMTQVRRVEVLERLRDLVAGSEPAAEEVMLVALTDTLRIEQPFTADRQRLLQTLQRMESDISLWLPPFDHLHELRFFRNLDRLVDLLGLVPGSKAVVLFSDLPGPSASYDLAFERLSAKSTHARVVFYPVLARGLSPTSAPRLARMAVETGGRFTENTNDLSLGYARAQRDLTCRYVIGFYDPQARRGEPRRISVRVRQRGLTALHPDNYGFPTDEEERDAHLQSALLAPEMFADTGVRVRLWPLKPDGKRWDTLVAVGFPAGLEVWSAADTSRDVAASLALPNRMAHEFRSAVVLDDAGDGPRPERAILIRRWQVRPGDYRLAAAVSDLHSGRPGADGSLVTLPEVPEADAFLVPPILGRMAGGSVLRVVDDESGTVDAEALSGIEPLFEPLLDPVLDPREPLSVLVHVCLRGTASATVEGSLVHANGAEVRRLTRHDVDPASGKRICKPLVEELEVSTLAPGDYRVDFSLTLGEAAATVGVSFELPDRATPR